MVFVLWGCSSSLFIVIAETFSLLESYAAEGSCMEAQRNDLEAKVDGKGFRMKWGFLVFVLVFVCFC